MRPSTSGTSMIIDLSPQPGDDPTFLLAVSAIAAAIARDERPTELRLIRIARWFDHKWLGYSGKGRVYFQPVFPNDPGVALDAMFCSKTTFPPFSPMRVLGERRYRRLDPDVGVREPRGKRVHPRRLTWSTHNLQRRVTTEIPGGAFVWFSSDTAVNRRGSVMTYVARGDDVTRWYASFLGTDGWRLGLVKGISREAVEALLPARAG